jgi:hydrogenase maturation protein HypF
MTLLSAGTDVGNVTAERVRIELTGVVQGVGFRPFVFRLAQQLKLVGWVKNDHRGVTVEVEGTRDKVRAFLERLPREVPDRAILDTLRATEVARAGGTCFLIRHSDDRGAPSVVVLPDTAVCDTCAEESLTPGNRRHNYPFTNCTNCGPRFSILRSLPYDRPNTTMGEFGMCEACQMEYESATDRRFHAQPNACQSCGPRIWLAGRDGQELCWDTEALDQAAQRIVDGQIVAIKGLGGFHLVVLASNEAAVRALRERKHRWEKPLAIMALGLDQIEALCSVDAVERQALASPEAPIVLLRRRPGTSIATSVAPGSPYLGVVLAYTPLHRLLLARVGQCVVATSGNLSDEPICIDNEDARVRLKAIADTFLLHNRPIERHVDDSVVAVVAGQVRLIRRARGYAPLPVRTRVPMPVTLALGTHQKNAVALGIADRVFISQHVGDLDTVEALRAHQRVAHDLLHLYAVDPAVIVHDLHPDYASTASAACLTRSSARQSPVERIGVQHHHAHFAACLAENCHEGPALGVIWDGTGYGSDRTSWGGEIFYGRTQRVLRVGHLRPMHLPGGDAAAREPRRAALAVLWELGQLDHPGAARLRAHFSPSERRLLVQMLDQGVSSSVTTSAGRLFDAVACLLGLRATVSYEGQAAVELEYLAAPSEQASYPLPVRGPNPVRLETLDSALARGAPDDAVVSWKRAWQIDWGPLLLALLDDLAGEAAPAIMAAKFHQALVDAIVTVACRTGAAVVALSGGCFQNRILVERSVDGLRRANKKVLLHRQVPTNDGGVCLGQVAVAASRLDRHLPPRNETLASCV